MYVHASLAVSLSLVPFHFPVSECCLSPDIAPEIIKHEPYSQMVDFFSLGVTIYRLLVGHRPFVATQRICVACYFIPILFPDGSLSSLLTFRIDG